MLGGIVKLQENLLVSDSEQRAFLYSFESHPKEITSNDEMILTIRGSYNEQLDAPHWVKDMTEREFLELLSELNLKPETFLSMLVQCRELQGLFESLREHEEPYEFLIQNKYNEKRVQELKANDPMGQLHNAMSELKEIIGEVDPEYFKDEEEHDIRIGKRNEGKYQRNWDFRTDITDLEELERLTFIDVNNLETPYVQDEYDHDTISTLIELTVTQNTIIGILIEKINQIGGNN